MAVLSSVVALCSILYAQERTNVGGKWVRTDEIDPPSGNRVVVFSLPADEADLGRSPAFQFVCTGDAKVVHAQYAADTPLRVTTGDYRNYYETAMTPKLRVDKKKTFSPIWDVFAGSKFAKIDKRTVRALLGSTELRVHFVDQNTNNFTDVFSPAGLDQRLLKRACGDNGWFEK
jgi:hypothetical protein